MSAASGRWRARGIATRARPTRSSAITSAWPSRRGTSTRSSYRRTTPRACPRTRAALSTTSSRSSRRCRARRSVPAIRRRRRAQRDTGSDALTEEGTRSGGSLPYTPVVPLDFDLNGKRALVTGASRGIGKAIAHALADAGADVAVTSRTGRAGDPVAEDLRRKGHKSLSLLLDVRHLVSIKACFDRLDDEWGRLDVLVNNAGTNLPRRIFEVTEEDWDVVLDTDLKGLFFVTQAAARRMVDASVKGRIVNIASQYGVVANVNRVSY